MKLGDIIAFSIGSLAGRKLRSWLTVLGIVIAVASIVTLISLAFGVQEQISSRLSTLGNDVMQVTSGGSRATRVGGGFEFGGLGGGGPAGGFGGPEGFGSSQKKTKDITFREAETLKRVAGVLAIDTRITGSAKVTYKSRNTTVQVVGVDPSAFKALNATSLIAGRMLSESDRQVAVLGFSVHNRTFSGEALLNRQIKIGDSYYRVVGLLNQSSSSFVASDGAIYVTDADAKIIDNRTGTDLNKVDSLVVKVAPGYTSDEVSASLTTTLAALHRVTTENPDFTVTTTAALQSTISSVTDTLTMFLGGIAAISLLVGAIGVANTMFMSVLERTKEIGVLKAIGMKDREITLLFIVEAAAIGVAGGAIGIALSLVASYVLTAFGVATSSPPYLLVGALVFSAIVGIVAGFVPARNASKLPPVEALRYE